MLFTGYFKGSAVVKRAADDRAEADIGLVERIIGDGRDLVHIDLTLRREIGLVYADVHDLADEAAALRVIVTTRQETAMGSSSMQGASTNSDFVAWKPARANLSGTWLPDTSPT